MIICVYRRFIQNFFSRKDLYVTLCRKESTSLMKARNDVQEQWEKKMKLYMKTYEDLFGITKLTEMHERVLEVQTNLQVVQEKRRKVQEEIFVAQKKLQEMQDILHKTSMGDDMYISLVTQVRELLKEQKRLQDTFSLYDQTEREQQTTLAMAINISQDHERTYREKNKYLSLITGVIGGILGLVGSSINNWRHRKDIKNFASEISEQVVNLKKAIDRLKYTLSTGDAAALNSTIEHSNEGESLLSAIKSQQEVLDDSLKSLQSVLNSNMDKVSNNQEYDGTISIALKELETNIDSKLNNHALVNLGMMGSCTLVLSLLVFYITRNS